MRYSRIIAAQSDGTWTSLSSSLTRPLTAHSSKRLEYTREPQVGTIPCISISTQQQRSQNTTRELWRWFLRENTHTHSHRIYLRAKSYKHQHTHQHISDNAGSIKCVRDECSAYCQSIQCNYANKKRYFEERFTSTKNWCTQSVKMHSIAAW